MILRLNTVSGQNIVSIKNKRIACVGNVEMDWITHCTICVNRSHLSWICVSDIRRTGRQTDKQNDWIGTPWTHRSKCPLHYFTRILISFCFSETRNSTWLGWEKNRNSVHSIRDGCPLFKCIYCARKMRYIAIRPLNCINTSQKHSTELYWDGFKLNHCNCIVQGVLPPDGSESNSALGMFPNCSLGSGLE